MWCSWLTRQTVTLEIKGSNPFVYLCDSNSNVNIIAFDLGSKRAIVQSHDFGRIVQWIERVLMCNDVLHKQQLFNCNCNADVGGSSPPSPIKVEFDSTVR